MPGGATIFLDSSGGVLNEAISIAFQVRKRAWNTAVATGARCDSGCSLIWLAGIQRRLDCGAKLGVHSVADSVTRTRTEGQWGNGLMAAAMSDLGAPEAMIGLALGTDPQAMSYIDCSQLQAWGLLAEPPPSPVTKQGSAERPDFLMPRPSQPWPKPQNKEQSLQEPQITSGHHSCSRFRPRSRRT
jgi:hypothetical protein